MGEGRTGLLSSLIIGVGGLIVMAVVLFVVLNAFSDSDLLRTKAETIIDRHTTINATCCILSNFSAGYKDYSISIVSTANETITHPIANYTLNTATGMVNNATASEDNMDDVNITYSFFIPSDYEMTFDSAGGNFTDGIDEVSGNIPTILLIAAVVLLFGVIALLVRQSQSMGIGGRNQGSL